MNEEQLRTLFRMTMNRIFDALPIIQSILDQMDMNDPNREKLLQAHTILSGENTDSQYHAKNISL